MRCVVAWIAKIMQQNRRKMRVALLYLPRFRACWRSQEAHLGPDTWSHVSREVWPQAGQPCWKGWTKAACVRHYQWVCGWCVCQALNCCLLRCSRTYLSICSTWTCILQLNTHLYTLNVKDTMYEWILTVVIGGPHLVTVLRTFQHRKTF